jgi:hypothetical protein
MTEATRERKALEVGSVRKGQNRQGEDQTRFYFADNVLGVVIGKPGTFNKETKTYAETETVMFDDFYNSALLRDGHESLEFKYDKGWIDQATYDRKKKYYNYFERYYEIVINKVKDTNN